MEPDLCVVLEGDDVLVHSVVLMGASPVIRQMLQADMSERHTGRVHLPDKSRAEFLDFVSMLELVRQTPLNDERAVYLSRWANEYEVEALTKLCEDHMLAKMPVDASNFAATLEHAVAHNLPRLAAAAIDVAAADICGLVRSPLTLELLLSCDEHAHKLWKPLCSAAGIALPSCEAPPPADHIKSMVPFVYCAIRTAARRKALVDKIKCLPRDIGLVCPHASRMVDTAATYGMNSLLSESGWVALLRDDHLD